MTEESYRDLHQGEETGNDGAMDWMRAERELAQHALDETRAEGIDHLYCGKCGGVEDVVSVDFKPEVRHLCRPCRVLILEWI